MDTDIQIIESLKQKLNITNRIVQKKWENGYLKYDKDKQKFYQEYSILSTDDEDSNKNEKIYRFYSIGTNKDYEFSDENDTKLDLTDEKKLDIVLAFIKPGLPSPTCPPSMPKYISPPTYGGKTCYKEKTVVNIKIKIPSANDFPDITPCNPNKPATPSNITPDQKPNGGGITPKPNKPSTPSTPNTVIPKESNTTPSRPSEPTPVTIINKTENKNNVNESQLATALPKQDVHQSEISRNIKTGDNMFNIGIMMIFSILGLAIYAGIEKFKKLNFKNRE